MKEILGTPDYVGKFLSQLFSCLVKRNIVVVVIIVKFSDTSML